MATFDSPYLLALFNRLAGRPTADAVTDVTKYQWLNEAQQELVSAMAAVCPNVLYPTGALPTMSTVDSSIFTFGTDTNGYPIAPIGKAGLYTSLQHVPDTPWREGVDYLNEGSQIRIPSNGTYTGTLYWRGITMPADLDATHAPALYPAASRVLLAYLATMNFSTAFTVNLPLADEMRAYLGTPWGQGPGAFARWCLTWRTQFRAGGVLGTITGRDLALGQQWS